MEKRKAASAPPSVRAGEELILECYQRSVELLKKNSRPSGVIACARSEKAVDMNYASVFGRDAAICALGMAVSGDRTLLRNARLGLRTLARYQAPTGQIPKYVKPESEEVDFWYAGCVDATLWWLIAVDFLSRLSPSAGGLREELGREVGLALNWLSCQEHQGMHLVAQNEASDWADIMPRSGFVLYSNALWYFVKTLYGIPTARETGRYFNLVFWPFGGEVPENRRARVLCHYVRNRARRSDFFLSFVNFTFWGEDLDVFGNVLAMLLGPVEASRAGRLADRLLRLGANEPYPVRVVLNPIGRRSRLWRPYMERHRLNRLWQYHNGGIWPFAGGFWVMLLAKLAREDLAWRELARVAEANRLGGWSFNEWLHGRSGEPMGMPGQSWNAAMFVLAFESLRKKLRL
ncbi:MAG: hypothetical protein Kow0025_24930 [Thermodesulfovibrionales bacterium]